MFLIAPVMLQPAAACSCDVSAGAPCAAVWRADAVFVGLVIDNPTERVGGTISWTVHKIAVSQTLRGSIDPFITLVPGRRPTEKEIEASKSYPGEQERMSTCDYRFEVGRQYVIYATHTADGGWTTSMCSGTKRLEDATADLDYIATIPSAPATGRVYGDIEKTIPDLSDPTTPLTVPAAGITVALTSESGRLTTTTDSEGKFDVHVPAGEYTIAPAVPETVRTYGSPNRARVPSRGCTPVHFSLVSNGRIEGRVIREDRTGVPHVRIDVIPADIPADRRSDAPPAAVSTTSDKNGRFEVDAILPGRYVIGVNASFGPMLDSPYPTTYFPGVAREDARTVELAEGERKVGFTIVVNPLAETTISGSVIAEDDRPVADARVILAVAGQKGMITDSTNTDGNGAFEIRALIGVTYTIRADTRTPSGLRRTGEAVVLVDGKKEGLRLSIRP